MTAETTHRWPPDGAWEMPCCGLTPFEAPRTDRMTQDPASVTCAGGRPISEQLALAEAGYAAWLARRMPAIADELTDLFSEALPDGMRFSWLDPTVWEAAADPSLPPGVAYISGYLTQPPAAGDPAAITGTVIEPPPRPAEVSAELAAQLEAAGWTPPGYCAMGCR